MIMMGVFLYKKAAAFEKLDVVTPTKKHELETMEEIKEMVVKLNNQPYQKVIDKLFKKDEMLMDETMLATHQNKKIVAWMLNRKRYNNEKERLAFFKTLNPAHGAPNKESKMDT